jgi:hypothetical protein
MITPTRFIFAFFNVARGNRIPHGVIASTQRATIVPMFYIGSSCSKIVVPFGAIPLNQLQSLRDRNPRGITFGYATRDHCFVIVSEGVIKKDFFYCLPYGGQLPLA